jgi:hypothetical protein
MPANACRRAAFTAAVIRASVPLPPAAISSSARQQVGTEATGRTSRPDRRRLGFEPAARETFLALRKDPKGPLYLAVGEVLAELPENPGSRRLRQLRYRPDTWGVPVRVSDGRSLVLWRPADSDPDS